MKELTVYIWRGAVVDVEDSEGNIYDYSVIELDDYEDEETEMCDIESSCCEYEDGYGNT